MAIVLILVDMLVAHQAEDLLLDAPSFRCQHLCTDTPYVKQLMADFRTGWVSGTCRRLALFSRLLLIFDSLRLNDCLFVVICLLIL